VTSIDKQRVAAVRKLEALGYSYRDDEWVLPASAPPAALIIAEADALLNALVLVQMASKRDARKAQTRRPSSPSSPTQSRRTRRYAGQRARCREGRGRFRSVLRGTYSGPWRW
jgi:hypothetical protein